MRGQDHDRGHPVSRNYAIDHDPGARFLRLKFIGLWDEAVLQAFVVEALALRTRVERAGHRDDGRGRILIDLTDFPVQPKTMTDSIASLLPTFGRSAGRVAVVRSSSALQHLQIQRLLPPDKARSFLSAAEATAWLSGQ